MCELAHTRQPRISWTHMYLFGIILIIRDKDNALVCNHGSLDAI
jgi:hypothetical protein